jgi:hypothetical protein
LYWSIPLKNVTKNMSGRYQKFMATNGDANSMVFASKPTAMAFVKIDGTIFTSKLIRSITDIKTKKMCMEKTALCFALAKAGIKTCVKAPSANIRRKRFGSLNAIKNISLYTPAPKTDAVSKSLKNPKILENKIPKLLVKIALNMGFFV